MVALSSDDHLQIEGAAVSLSLSLYIYIYIYIKKYFLLSYELVKEFISEAINPRRRRRTCPYEF